MKRIFLIACISGCSLSCTHTNIIDLPITARNGYGPFALPNWIEVSPNQEDENWEKTHPQATGIPGDWTDTKKGDIDTDFFQAVYQNYFRGNISQALYEKMQQSNHWTPDTLTLSKEPVKTKIAFVFGKDATGELKMVVDANSNLDFSDDAIFTPIDFELYIDSFLKDSLALEKAVMVTCERLSDNKIIQEQVPLFIAQRSATNEFFCNFPQYTTAQMDGQEIAINSDRFADLSYFRSNIALIDDSLKNGGKINSEQIVSIGEYLTVKGKVYKNKGVNRNKNVLVLEKIDSLQNQLCSTQVGFKTRPFEGQSFITKEVIFITKEVISSEDYKGKYLLLDFWAVWCVPCVQELPALKEMYDKLDKSKVEIVGIVGDSPADGLEKMIEKHAITWPQIRSDNTNNITTTYGVQGYPATFLIDPDGMIVAKNLRGKALEDKINELTTQKP